MLIPWQGWSLTAHDFLVTRLMEIVVHSDDLAASVGLPTPEFPDDGRRAGARPADPASPCAGTGQAAAGPRAEPAAARAGVGLGVLTWSRRTSARRTTRCRTDPAEVGVGPWAGEWPDGEQYDERLLAEGDRRNVVDRYRYWRLEAIVADLDTRRHDFHVAIENWQHDFNIGTIVRTANAFLAARGAHRRQPAVEPARRDGHRPLPARAAPRRRRPTWRRTCTSDGGPVPLLGIDNLPGLGPPGDDGDAAPGLLPVRSGGARALASGRATACDGTFSIAQFGSTRSINASAAAAIAMHTWIRAHADLGHETAWRG